jgi:hypothetical protein
MDDTSVECVEKVMGVPSEYFEDILCIWDVLRCYASIVEEMLSEDEESKAHTLIS